MTRSGRAEMSFWYASVATESPYHVTAIGLNTRTLRATSMSPQSVERLNTRSSATAWGSIAPA